MRDLTGLKLLRDNDPDREITETKMIYSRCNMQLDGQLISLMITESIYWTFTCVVTKTMQNNGLVCFSNKLTTEIYYTNLVVIFLIENFKDVIFPFGTAFSIKN